MTFRNFHVFLPDNTMLVQAQGCHNLGLTFHEGCSPQQLAVELDLQSGGQMQPFELILPRWRVDCGMV